MFVSQDSGVSFKFWVPDYAHSVVIIDYNMAEVVSAYEHDD